MFVELTLYKQSCFSLNISIFHLNPCQQISAIAIVKCLFLSVIHIISMGTKHILQTLDAAFRLPLRVFGKRRRTVEFLRFFASYLVCTLYNRYKVHSTIKKIVTNIRYQFVLPQCKYSLKNKNYSQQWKRLTAS